MKKAKIGGVMKTQFILLFSLLMLLSCENEVKKNEQNMSESQHSNKLTQQTKEALLNGSSKAICYSGFRSGQHPDRGDGAVNPSYEETLEDLKMLSEDADFHMIRVYDSGENSELVLRVIQENNLNIKVMLGIWLHAELSAHETCAWLTEPIPQAELEQNKEINQAEIEKAIVLAQKYQDIIIAVNVGNEALVDWNDHKVAPDTIISYVKRMKQSISQMVTVADNYKWWAEHGSELAKVVDFVSLHIYPVWEGKDIDEGISYTIENYNEVRKAIPNAPIAITEAGWATIATEFGERASEEKQWQYYQELMKWSDEMNITTFWFEAFDEDWKGEPGRMNGAEKHWGLYTVERIPKLSMKQILAEQN